MYTVYIRTESRLRTHKKKRVFLKKTKIIYQGERSIYLTRSGSEEGESAAL